MKAKRVISPAVISGLVLVALLVIVGVIGFVSRGLQGEPPLVDDGPNAGLSNGELVNKAVTNMRQLSSFHMDFSGPIVIEGNPGQQMTLAADIQLPGPGNWTGREGTPVPGSTFKMRVEAHTYEDQELPASEVQTIWASDGKWYASTDGGDTWVMLTLDEVAFTLGYYLDLWRTEQYWGPSLTEEISSGTASSPLTFTDGSPRLEKLDGVVTRHVTADVSSISAAHGPWSDPPARLDLWISTESTPTVRKLVAHGNRGTPTAFNSLGFPGDIALSRDGRTLAAAYDSNDLYAAYDNSSGRAPEYPGAIRLWDLARPDATPRVLPADQSLSWISLSGDGRYVAAGSMEGGHTYVWDLSSEKPVSTTLPLLAGASGGVVTGFNLGNVAVRSDGEMVAALTKDSLNIWGLPADKTKPPLFSDPSVSWLSYSTLASSPDNKTLAVSVDEPNEGSIRLYDWRNPASPPRKLPLTAGTPVLHTLPVEMVFSPDGSLLAGYSYDNVRIWDLRESNPSPALVPGTGPYSGGIAFGSAGRLLAVGAKERMVQIWRVDLAGASPRTPTLLLELDAGNAVSSIDFSLDGRYLVAGTQAGPVLIWSLEDLQTPGKVKTPPKARALVGSEAKELVGGEPYTLTWTWSRFNEEFGEVKPPLTETVR